MTGTKTNERPGTRAQVRHARFSATKARAVLDIIRNLPAHEAAEVLQFTERGASEAIGRCLASAVANAQHNDELDADTLYVSACYADEGPTLKRWRPRARGRATRIRKRTCHITIIVSPMTPEQIARVEAKRAAAPAAVAGRRGRAARESRRTRVARSRRAQGTEATVDEHERHDHDHEAEPSAAAEAVTTDQVVSDAISSDADIEESGDATPEGDAGADEEKS